jgi:hypothetical protein
MTPAASPEALKADARALALAGRWPEAMRLWRTLAASGQAEVEDWCEALGLIAKHRARTGARAARRRLRLAAAHAPEHPRVWGRLASAFLKLGDLDDAIAASERRRDLGEETLNTQEWRDRLVHHPRRDPARKGPRVLVIGNCQALGLALCLRRACPTAQVVGEQWAAHQDEAAAGRLLEALDGYDLVLSQPFGRAGGALSSERLAERGRRLLPIPRILFGGFHPDLVAQPNATAPPGTIFRGWYSALIAAAFRLGAPPERAAELFNAYVYGVLGYFDAFAAAEQLQLAEGRRLGFDLEPLLPQWKASGVFVHVPSHPTTGVLQSMARAVCAREGLAVRPDAPAPHDVQAERMVWPVYPEIARRLGVEGSLRFTPHAPNTPIGLKETIAHFYGLYARAGAPEDPKVLETAQALRREGV